MGVSTTLEFCLHVGFGSTLAVKKNMYICHYIHIILVFHSGFRRQSTIRKVWLGRFILGGGESFPAVSCDVKYCHSNVFQSKGINLQLQDVSNILL